MTEADLDRLMVQGARRLRLQRAVVMALVVFGISVLAAAVATFAVRIFVIPWSLGGNLDELLVHGALTAPIAAGIIALFASYFHYQPAPSRVAITLDRGGASHEHLVTWLEYRSRKVDGELQQGFRAAQLAATLKCAEHFNARKLIPVRLPDWSRALWMSILLLCCAWLMPPRAAVRQIHIVDAPAKATLTLKIAGDGGADAGGPQTPRVEVLNPTDLFDFQLKASDPELSQKGRSDALQDLMRIIGSVPESELTPEVRELLNAFRNGSEIKSAANNNTDDGSKQLKAKNAALQETTSATELGVPAVIPAAREKAMTIIESQFTDVKEQLERYYQFKK